jgi:hypothetical protein
VQGFNGDNILATNANLNQPIAIHFDTNGNIYFSDCNNFRVRKINIATNIITTVVGSGAQGFYGDGGQATSASLNWAQGFAIDTIGNIFVSDTNNFRIRKINFETGF